MQKKLVAAETDVFRLKDEVAETNRVRAGLENRLDVARKLVGFES